MDTKRNYIPKRGNGMWQTKSNEGGAPPSSSKPMQQTIQHAASSSSNLLQHSVIASIQNPAAMQHKTCGFFFAECLHQHFNPSHVNDREKSVPESCQDTWQIFDQGGGLSCSSPPLLPGGFSSPEDHLQQGCHLCDGQHKVETKSNSATSIQEGAETGGN